MPFNVNDKVELIDESVKGRIVSINGNHIVILTEEGFEMEVLGNEIMKTGAPAALQVTDAEIAEALKEKEAPSEEKRHKANSGMQNISPMEIDLHIHHLVGSTRGMTNYEMLTLQLEEARNALAAAMEKRIQKVIFIHGVGAGVLKTELEGLFKGYKNLTYYDADFKTYGFGATEVYIYQNY